MGHPTTLVHGLAHARVAPRGNLPQLCRGPRMMPGYPRGGAAPLIGEGCLHRQNRAVSRCFHGLDVVATEARVWCLRGPLGIFFCPVAIGSCPSIAFPTRPSLSRGPVLQRPRFRNASSPEGLSLQGKGRRFYLPAPPATMPASTPKSISTTTTSSSMPDMRSSQLHPNQMWRPDLRAL